MIKVLHYVGVMNRAGAETFIMNMFRSLDREKYSFDFLCSLRAKGDYDDEIKNLGGQMFYVDLSDKDGVKRHVSNYFILKKEFSKYVKEYDVIHIHTYHALDMYIPTKAAVDAGFSKVIAHSHSNSADGHFTLHRIFRVLLSKLPIVKMACTEDAWNWMFNQGEKVLIGNGIDTSDYKFCKAIREEKRYEFNINDEIVLGHVGRFDQVKNHSFLVDIFNVFCQKYPNSKLLLVGKGIETDNIKEKCEMLGLSSKVIFAGLRTDVNQLLQAMDVFVFPSTYEGLGMAIIEAESSGLPCIVSDNVPADVDICQVKHLSLKSTPEEWVKEIEKQVNNSICRPAEYKKIAAAGYDIRENCERLMKAYGE